MSKSETNKYFEWITMMKVTKNKRKMVLNELVVPFVQVTYLEKRWQQMAIQGNLPGIVALLEQDLNLVSLQVGNLERDVYHCHHRSKIVFPALYRELAAHDRNLFQKSLSLQNCFHQSVSNESNFCLYGFFSFLQRQCSE